MSTRQRMNKIEQKINKYDEMLGFIPTNEAVCLVITKALKNRAERKLCKLSREIRVAN